MKKYSHETIVGIFLVIGLLVIGYMTIKLGDVSLLGDNSYSLYAEFSSVSGLRKGNPIEIFGMEVGQVGGFSMDQENQQVILELKIKNGIHIYDDAIAAIKTAGLIGDKYVSIDPGGSDEVLENGDTILDTESPIDLGDLIGKYAFGDVKGASDQTEGEEK
jgi:phospholipid/cholesterol/gamma-HCH transport system substrate-binding protein